MAVNAGFDGKVVPPPAYGAPPAGYELIREMPSITIIRESPNVATVRFRMTVDFCRNMWEFKNVVEPRGLQNSRIP